MPRLVIVSPCYNEEAILAYSARELIQLLERLIVSHKILPTSHVLYVNDGSRDRTWEMIEELHQENTFIDGLCLAGNVGSELAVMAGLMTAKDEADVVVSIDADLQDDLGVIEEMIDRYLEGYDIVYGVKKSRQADPFLKRTTAQAFYRLQQSMGIRMVYNHTNFRLMSRRALEALSRYPERNLYLRGIIPMLGYPSTTVDDIIRERVAGESKYNYRKLLFLAVDGITSFTTRPISWIVGMGFFCLLISILMAVYVLVSYIEHLAVPGWASLMLSLWFIGSMLLLSLGVVGQYIGKIYIEVKDRPRYHIAQHLQHHD
ncbi:glycosyltransferase family 2 protein [Porphyromonas sp. oral taxon 278]|uniref:glycosyltransferase family 2 protein n=1 Tax=Porphyromonas sp. oral taxon 278 TaxID=712437 RepID=UPI0018DDCA18|nr:glycosyltransferase family 2 protein [Porphyromonas sp. oral taxon 278]